MKPGPHVTNLKPEAPPPDIAEAHAFAPPPAGVGGLDVDDATLWQQLYPEHLATLRARLDSLCAVQGLSAVVVPAGEAPLYAFDDQPVPFRANPHFLHWLPALDSSGSVLLLAPGATPELLFLKPEDYWHQPPPVPAPAAGNFTVSTFATREALSKALHERLARLERASSASRPNGRIVFIGEDDLPLPADATRNPPAVLAALHYARAVKSPFELVCLLRASQRAACGHQAVAAAFTGGGRANSTEFSLHQAYLSASSQTAADLPYSSIVALNEHAGVLHYQHYDRRPPVPVRSLLIDAGASWSGYASDVTRTYAAVPGLFADLIAAVTREQQALIATIRPEQSYLHLHADMHRRICGVLSEAGVFRCSAEEACAKGLSEAFFPHGLGHLLGLQTHDVGGLFVNAAGEIREPPDNYAALRLTRPLEVGQVFTIEPGIYFIDMLLEPLLASAHGRLLDAAAIEALKPCGGIRIEDNVAVTSAEPLNLTRYGFEHPEHHQ
ncbi:MAG: Xaa-Pro dipeptidase [Pseudomonadota bacterium]